MTRAVLAALLGMMLLARSTALAQPAGAASLTADEIVRRMLEHDAFGWEGAEARLRMVLRNDRGEVRERAFRSISRRDATGLVRSVVRFESPPEVAGSAFLLIQHRGAPSEQYVYLPRLHRTRRIAAQERSGSFMGSDFTYADLERRSQRDGRSRRLPDETIAGFRVFVVEATPGPDDPYARVVSWIRQDNYIPLRVQFFARDGQLEKTLFTRRIREISGRPVIVESHMENARTRHVTDLFVDALAFRNDFADDLFTPAALEHP